MPAAYIILIREGKLLLQLRSNTGYEDGKYSLVAGHVDDGETFLQAIIREAKEEANITLQTEDVKMVHVMHRQQDCSYPHERLDMFFYGEKWEGEIQNMEPHKHKELAWFPMHNLPDNVIPCVRYALELFEKGVVYSEYGWE